MQWLARFLYRITFEMETNDELTEKKGISIRNQNKHTNAYKHKYE